MRSAYKLVEGERDEPAMATRPPIHGFHHFSATACDVEAGASWYRRAAGLKHLPAAFPYYGADVPGYAIVLITPTQVSRSASTTTKGTTDAPSARHRPASITSH
jgi:hypothetical protein